MTRARNIAGFSTITTTPSPVHVGPIGVLTATRIDGEFGVVDVKARTIEAVSIAATNFQVSGITTGLNVSGIITAQNGINFNGTSTGLNVSGIGTIATLNVSGNATIAGVLTYEDVTRVDSVGVVTARGLSIFGNTTGLQVASGISTFQAITGTTGTFSTNSSTAYDGTAIQSGGARLTIFNSDNTTSDTFADIHFKCHQTSTGDARIGMELPSVNNSELFFVTENSGTLGERLRITSAGKIGVGTVSPDTPFHIYTDDPQQITVERSTNQNSNIRFRNTFGSMFAGLTSNATGFAIDDDDDLGAAPMFIVTKASGDVGINRTPTQNDMPGVTPRLHVLGISTVGQFNTVARFESGTTDGNDTGAAVVINQTNDRGLVIQGGRGGNADGVHHANSGLGRFSIINNSGTFHKFMEAWGQNGQYIENISLFTGNEVERLRITSAGKIGINATNPNSLLEVRGTAGTYTNAVTVFSGNTTHSGSNAKIGIALHSFGDALSGGLSSNLLYSNSSSPTQTYATRSSGEITFSNTTSSNATSEIKFGGYYKGTTSFVERLRINSTGEVGIGVAAASGNLLHIKPSSVADAFAKIESESGYDAALLLDTSNGSGASADVRFQMDGTTKGSIQYVNNASSADVNSMIFRTGNNSAKMQITSDGQVNIGGDYSQTTYDFSVNGSARFKHTEADIWLETTSGPAGIWRILGSTGTNTHKFRIYDQTNTADRFNIDSTGAITKPTNPIVKTNMSSTYGSSGSLTTNTANVGILQAAAAIDRGNNGWTTSGSNAYTFVCPVDGIYVVHAHVSYGNAISGRQIWVLSYTLGGGNLPLSSYVEVMDHTAVSYANFSYYDTYHFTAGTRLGFGKNGGSGSITGQSLQWGCHLLQ